MDTVEITWVYGAVAVAILAVLAYRIKTGRYPWQKAVVAPITRRIAKQPNLMYSSMVSPAQNRCDETISIIRP